MISSLEARNIRGLVQSFEIANSSNGFQIRDIEGLDPVRANLVSTNFANMDGEQYQSSRREKRNIIITIGLAPDYATNSVSSLRQSLYSFFMPKSQVELSFMRTDGDPVSIMGRVETLDAPLFTSDPTVSVSIVCFDPDFLLEAVTYSNVSSQGSIVMHPIPYLGTVSTGIKLTINIVDDVAGFNAVSQITGDVSKTLIYDGNLLENDVVTLSTVPGNKYITLLRGSELTSILSGVSPYSDWLSFDVGENKFGLQMDSDPQPFELSYITRLGGL